MHHFCRLPQHMWLEKPGVLCIRPSLASEYIQQKEIWIVCPESKLWSLACSLGARVFCVGLLPLNFPIYDFPRQNSCSPSPASLFPTSSQATYPQKSLSWPSHPELTFPPKGLCLRPLSPHYLLMYMLSPDLTVSSYRARTLKESAFTHPSICTEAGTCVLSRSDIFNSLGPYGL